ncbi:MAG: hypothetical protein WDA22_15185 [Bacteroidota bacterium]
MISLLDIIAIVSLLTSSIYFSISIYKTIKSDFIEILQNNPNIIEDDYIVTNKNIRYRRKILMAVNEILLENESFRAICKPFIQDLPFLNVSRKNIFTNSFILQSRLVSTKRNKSEKIKSKIYE